jgi:vitamin B12 transporter
MRSDLVAFMLSGGSDALPSEPLVGTNQEVSQGGASLVRRKPQLVVSVLGLAAAALALAPPVCAEPTFDLDDLVVTGSMEPLRLQDSPTPVTVVTRKAIEARRPLDPAEALSTTPGLNILRSGGLGSLTSLQIRGSSSNDVQVLQDGRPLNHPALGGADLSTIPIDQIDHIEVIRGPFSALYGGNAMSGAVQLFTKAPSASDKSSLTLMGGSLGTSDLSARLNIPLGAANLLVVPTIRNTDGNRPNSRNTLGNGFVRLDADTGGHGHLTLSAGVNDSVLGVPGPQPAADLSKRSATQSVLGSDQISTSYDHTRTGERFAQAEWHDDRWTARIYHTAWLSDFYNKSYVDPTLPATFSENYVREYLSGVETRYRIPHLQKSALTLGALYERGYTDSVNDITGFDQNNYVMLDAPQQQRFQGRRDNRAVYGEEALVFDKVSATLGLRADNPTGFAGQLSPRVNVLYRPLDWLGLRAAWGRGYRAPSLDELYYPNDGSYVGNNALKPERSTMTELGTELKLGRQALLRTTWFNDEVSDQIVSAPTGPMGLYGPLFTPSNLQHLHKSGLEAQVTWQPLDALTFNTTWSHLNAVQTRAEVTDGNLNTISLVNRPAANVPRDRTTLSATYRQPQGWWLQADAQLLGQRYQYYANYQAFPTITYDTKSLPSACIVDLTVGTKTRLAGLETDVYVKAGNLGNQRYALVFGDSINDRNYPMPGRTIYLGVSPKF